MRNWERMGARQCASVGPGMIEGDGQSLTNLYEFPQDCRSTMVSRHGDDQNKDDCSSFNKRDVELVIVHCSLLLNTEPNAGDRHFMGLLMTNTWQIYNNWHWSWKKASVSTLNTHLKLGVIVYSMNNTIGGDPKWVPNTPHNTSRSHSTRGGGVLSGPCFVGTIRAYTQQILADSTYQGFHVELKGDGQHGQVWCSSHLA